MTSPRLNNLCGIVLSLSLLLLGSAAGARVSINGYVLSAEEIRLLEARLASRIPPGDYLVDGNGCWVNLSNGLAGCPGTEAEYNSRHGSGSTSPDGTWNHWSSAAEGAVGGTADGCIYTTNGWSNC